MFASLMLGSMIALAAPPPIALASCDVTEPVTVWSNDDAPSTVGPSTLHVRFSDIAPESISRVTFTLDDGSTINDVGTFSPGIAIDHDLRLASAAATTCVVSAVTFADGATWQAPAVSRSPNG